MAATHHLHRAYDLIGRAIAARDGEIGSVADLLFEDDRWSVRWLVVDTGGWLGGRQVLLPVSQIHAPAGSGAIPVDLNREQVKQSPGLDADQPVSRQLEASLYVHYGWQPYWPAPAAAGMAYVPPLGPLSPATAAAQPDVALPQGERPSGDPHLRSIAEVTGYDIHASDGHIGHVEDFLVDPQDWSIRYVVVDTKNWWPGKQVLIDPGSVAEVDWADREVRVRRSREEIRAAPDAAADEPGRDGLLARAELRPPPRRDA